MKIVAKILVFSAVSSTLCSDGFVIIGNAGGCLPDGKQEYSSWAAVVRDGTSEEKSSVGKKVKTVVPSAVDYQAAADLRKQIRGMSTSQLKEFAKKNKEMALKEANRRLLKKKGLRSNMQEFTAWIDS